ncbi:MAG: Nif3-like dinuclear metal center hexameric protein [Verrucomicrobia bacterium]|nr:Nif3-like dinuclear metal center hexameric protein [Verrucomicrobiota bacterium]MBS0636322.1 Nif3-like dinuclear metal center hexameric protein [Verrucomicrobiota bacterium]
MPTQLKTFSHYIDTILHTSAFQDVCINGMQVEGKKKIQHLAVAVTASLHAIKRAKAIKADALLVHHGLFLKGKDVVIQNSLKEMLALLLGSDISLFAYHLPLDAHQELGNNWPAAKMLGWTDLEPFGYYQGMPIGVKGTCPPTSQEKFKKTLEKFYHREAISVLAGPKTIRSCALISGGAHKSLQEAVQNEVDCFITGTTDEPVWHIAHQDKINFFALGHAATETVGVQLLGQHLADHFDLRLSYIHENNPF